MTSAVLFSSFSSLFNFGEAAGFAGHIFAIVLSIAPIPTFRRIIKNRSTEEFSGLLYIYTLLNCLVCLWYGLPIISPGIVMVATVNAIGVFFQIIYISIFIACAERTKKIRMIQMVAGVFALFIVIVIVSLELFQPPLRKLFVGYCSIVTLISMFASPLAIINLVIRTKSVEFMPIYISISAFLLSLSFFVYGLCKHDAYVAAPNGVGSLLGIAQLVLYTYYSRFGVEEAKEPFLVSYA